MVGTNGEGRLDQFISELIKGSIDMHVHAGPDGLKPRHGTAFEVADAARNAGMAAMVLKNKRSGTGALACLLNALVPDLASIGAVTLDHHVGGLNPSAVEAEADLGSRVVWMPTHQAANALRHHPDPAQHGLTIVDDGGRLVDAVGDVLSVIEQREMVLCTGHLGREEVFALVREARRREIRTVVTHPLVRVTRLSLDDQRELADLGAFMEYTFVATMPNHGRMPMEDIVSAIRAIGVQRCLVSTDFGQIHNPPPAEGMRMAIASLVRHGLSAEEIGALVRTTPQRLLGLPASSRQTE